MPTGFSRRLYRFAAIIAAIAAACDDSSSVRGDPKGSGQHPDAVPRQPAGRAPAETVAAYPFRWDVARVRGALETAGLKVQDLGRVRQPFMSVNGTTFRIGEAELQVFVYGDVGAMTRDVMRLDTVRVSPPTMMINWRSRPSLVTKNNLAAIILTDDEALRSRICAALTVEPHATPHPGPD